MNIVKKYPFNCTECGDFAIAQNKRPMANGCQRRFYCNKCQNTYVVQYNQNDEPVKVVNAYKKINILN